MVKKGDINVNTELKFISLEPPAPKSSKLPINALGLGGDASNKYGLPWMELHYRQISANSSMKFLVQIDAVKHNDSSIIEFSIGKFSKKPSPVYKGKVDSKGNPVFPKPNSMKKK